MAFEGKTGLLVVNPTPNTEMAAKAHLVKETAPGCKFCNLCHDDKECHQLLIRAKSDPAKGVAAL